MKIRRAADKDFNSLIRLIAAFSVELATLRGVERPLEIESASQELREYLEKDYPIFVSEDQRGEVQGYLVCRVEGDVVWAESLYVNPAQRRKGIAGVLYDKVELLAFELGNQPPYNWVYPNNQPIIQFLERRGYNVLNLIELRQPRPGEKRQNPIQVGDYKFLY